MNNMLSSIIINREVLVYYLSLNIWQDVTSLFPVFSIYQQTIRKHLVNLSTSLKSFSGHRIKNKSDIDFICSHFLIIFIIWTCQCDTRFSSIIWFLWRISDVDEAEFCFHFRQFPINSSIFIYLYIINILECCSFHIHYSWRFKYFPQINWIYNYICSCRITYHWINCKNYLKYVKYGRSISSIHISDWLFLHVITWELLLL